MVRLDSLAERFGRWMEKRLADPGNQERVSARWRAEYAVTSKPDYHAVAEQRPKNPATAEHD